jgi:hemolysin activation/secretion protein
VQPLVFVDWARLVTLSDPSGPRTKRNLSSAGIGLRASIYDRTLAELYLARPRVETDDTDADFRLQFAVSTGF